MLVYRASGKGLLEGRSELKFRPWLPAPRWVYWPHFRGGAQPWNFSCDMNPEVVIVSPSLREEMVWPNCDLFEGSCSRCLLNLEVQTTGVECHRHYTSLKNPICKSFLIPPNHAGYFFQATPKEKPVIVLILTNWRQSGHKHSPLCLSPSTRIGQGCREPVGGRLGWDPEEKNYNCNAFCH